MPKRLLAALLLFVFSTLCSSQTQSTSFPGGALLAGTADQFTAYCKAELDKASAGIAKLKGLPRPRNTMAALQTFDDTNLIIGNVGNRAGLAQQVESDEAFR